MTIVASWIDSIGQPGSLCYEDEDEINPYGWSKLVSFKSLEFIFKNAFLSFFVMEIIHPFICQVNGWQVTSPLGHIERQTPKKFSIDPRHSFGLDVICYDPYTYDLYYVIIFTPFSDFILTTTVVGHQLFRIVPPHSFPRSSCNHLPSAPWCLIN